MKWVLLVLAMVVTIGAKGSISASAESPVAEEVFIKEVQAAGQAWQYSGVELPQGYVATVTATGAWEINETWGRKVGAAGNSDYQAADGYVKSGSNEGCLLVRVGDKVIAFSRDDETIKIDTPGRIYFCANDLPTEGGVAKSKDFLSGLPIKAHPDAGGSGFTDNSESLKVRLSVKKSEK